MEVIATHRFAVFEPGRGRGTTEERTAVGGANSGAALKSSTSSDTADGNRAAVGRALAFEKGGTAIEIPSMRLREMNNANASRFTGLMEKHGFIVLTETGAIRDAYVEFMELLKAFFDGDSEFKESCKGGVHFNERGIPMWHAGYERCGDVREAFRVPAPFLSPSSALGKPWPCPRLRRAWLVVLRLLQRVCHRALTLTLGRPVLGAPPPSSSSSSSSSSKAETKRRSCTSSSRRRPLGEAKEESGEHCPVCGSGRARGTPEEGGGADTCAVGSSGGGEGGGGADGEGSEARRRRFVCSESSDDGRGHAGCGSSSGSGIGNGNGVERARNGKGHEDDADDGDGDDFSVSYALHYPNELADPALEEEDLTVGKHVDPSLFVAEPCCGVEGLEICDRASGRWIPVEAVCAGLGADGSGGLAEGRELILFGGRALERATGGRVRGAPHRVRRGDLGRRYCFIYEQKYAEFFPPPTLD